MYSPFQAASWGQPALVNYQWIRSENKLSELTFGAWSCSMPTDKLVFNKASKYIKISQILFNITVGVSRLCSITFQQPLALGATFCSSRTLEHLLPFWVTFEQNIGLGYIPSTKKSTISQKTSSYVNFFPSAYQSNGKRSRVKKLMTFWSIIKKRIRALAHSELGLPVLSSIFVNNSLKISFKLFFFELY